MKLTERLQIASFFFNALIRLAELATVLYTAYRFFEWLGIPI